MRCLSFASMFTIVGLAASWLGVSSVHSQTLEPEPVTVTVAGQDFLSGDDDKTVKAKNVSGIACVMRSGRKRACLAADDEAWFAQSASLSQDDTGNWTFFPSKSVLEFFKPLSAAIPLGEAPKWRTASRGEDCKNKPQHQKLSETAEFDGEGVAFDGKYFYVAGSHGCGRSEKNNFKVSSMLVARIAFNADGTLGKPLLSHRLATTLESIPAVAPHFLRRLEPENATALRGLNIEGIAVYGGHLFAGLRAPVLEGRAILIRVPVEQLFERDGAGEPAAMISISVPIGSGIRDLSATANGTLVILTGPEIGEGNMPAIGTIPVPDGSVSSVDVTYRSLAPGQGKAEAVLPLDDSGDTVMVLYDGAINGGPQVFRLSQSGPERAEVAPAPIAASLAGLSPTAKKRTRFSRQDRRVCRTVALRRLARIDPPTASERRRIFRRSYRACLSRRG